MVTSAPRKTNLDDPTVVGERTEAIVLAELLRLGHRVLIPFGHSHKYDLAVDLDGHLVRIQCKTARVNRNGVIYFNSCTTRSRQSYKGVADIFAVYCAGTTKIYFIPVMSVPDSAVSLRLSRPVNNQALKIRMASDYETLDLSLFVPTIERCSAV